MRVKEGERRERERIYSLSHDCNAVNFSVVVLMRGKEGERRERAYKYDLINVT